MTLYEKYFKNSDPKFKKSLQKGMFLKMNVVIPTLPPKTSPKWKI